MEDKIVEGKKTDSLIFHMIYLSLRKNMERISPFLLVSTT